MRALGQFVFLRDCAAGREKTHGDETGRPRDGMILLQDGTAGPLRTDNHRQGRPQDRRQGVQGGAFLDREARGVALQVVEGEAGFGRLNGVATVPDGGLAGREGKGA